jgi:uncharacterized protein involved in exopolysaccharide biosynthesis
MLDRLQLQLQAAMTALSEAMNRRSAMEAQLANDAGELPPLPATALADPRLVQLQMLKRRLTTLEAEYTENYPDIQITKEEIAQLEIELKLNVTAGSQTNPTTALSAPPASPAGSGEVTLGQEIARLQQQQHALAEQISLYEKRVEETPKREQEMAGLMRNYEATKENYNILLSKAGNAKISENMEKRQKGEQFRILDPANYPEQPFKPDLSELLLIGLLLGAGIGGGLALMLENFDTSIKQSDELEAEFGIQVLSVIPKAALLCKPTELNGATAGVAPVLPKEARS